MMPYFEKHHKELLDFANTEAGRYLLGIKDKDRIVKLTPNSYHQVRDVQKDKAVIEGRFTIAPTVGNLLLPIITKLEIANDYKHIDEEMRYKAFLHYAGLERSKLFPQVHLATATYDNAFTTIGCRSTGALATIRAATNAVLVMNYVNSDGNCGFHCSFDSSTYIINRWYFNYDTSAIPDSATIASAFLRIPGSATSIRYDNGYTIGVYENTTGSNTTLDVSDWKKWNTTLFGSLALSSYSGAANNDIALNAAGLAIVSKSSYTKLFGNLVEDVANATPTGFNNATFNLTGQLLSVTYTVGGAALLMMFSQ